MIYKRKKEGKTDYRNRIAALKSGKVRLVVRKSLKNIYAQIIQYQPDGDKILFSANSNELKKYGWNLSRKNTPAAYLTGILIGHKAKQKGIKEAILDIGFKRAIKGCVLFALLKGAIDSGLNIPHSKEVFPSEERIKGKHIQDYYHKCKEKFTKENPENMQKQLEEAKLKILK